jgi:hypothetical protein
MNKWKTHRLAKGYKLWKSKRTWNVLINGLKLWTLMKIWFG